MELALSLAVPYVTDPGTAARLRAVSKPTKEAVDACHADLLIRSQQRSLLQFYVRMEMARLMAPSMLMAQDTTPAFADTNQVRVEMGHPAYHIAPPPEKKKPWWRFRFCFC